MLSDATVRPVNNRQLFMGAICKLLGRSGPVINAIAATFMNSGADSVDLLPKPLSTIAAVLLKCTAVSACSAAEDRSRALQDTPSRSICVVKVIKRWVWKLGKAESLVAEAGPPVMTSAANMALTRTSSTVVPPELQSPSANSRTNSLKERPYFAANAPLISRLPLNFPHRHCFPSVFRIPLHFL